VPNQVLLQDVLAMPILVSPQQSFCGVSGSANTVPACACIPRATARWGACCTSGTRRRARRARAGKQLDVRDRLWTLEVDLEPFDSSFPHMSCPTSIGDGVRFLNRRARAAEAGRAVTPTCCFYHL